MGKERRARKAPTLLTITNFHILTLFLQQHENNGDGKTNRQTSKNKNTKMRGRKEESKGLTPS